MEKKRDIHRLWQPIVFHDNWQNCDTSILDDISAALAQIISEI